MLSAPFYFTLGLGISLVFLVLLLFLLYFSIRQRKAELNKNKPKPEAKFVWTKLELNAKVSDKNSAVATNSRLGNSFSRATPDFNINTYNRVKKLLEENKDIKTIAREEKLSLGEVKLIASLSE